MTLPVTGVYCAATTPVKPDLSPDFAAFAAHCRWLIDEGCTGVALLGTTGEANSFSSSERRQLLEAALKAGLTGDQLLPGTGLANIPETIDLTRHALSSGVHQVVMLPPFYYKGVSDEGLFQAYAKVIEGVASDRLRVILYHIPQMTGLPISHNLIGRLVEAFPGIVAGIKDSAGQFDNMTAMLARFKDFSVLAGADPLLLPLMQAGGAGCITATSNLVARSLATVYKHANDPAKAAEVEAAQANIVAHRNLSNSYVQIPAIKAMVGFLHGDPSGWARTRPPLVALSAAELADLRSNLLEIGAAVNGA